MAIAWFITIYKRRGDNTGWPPYRRYCAMDDYTPLIYGEGGVWAESEVLGNYALVKVRASDTTLATIAADPLFLRIPLNHLDLTLGELTPQQRAARVTWALAQRALQGLPGLSTAEIGDLLGITCEGARQVMCKLSANGGVPVTQIDGLWVALPEELEGEK